MFEPDYSHYVLPYNNNYFYRWRSYFSVLDLDGSGHPDLIQAGPASTGAGVFLGVSADYGLGSGFNFGPNSGTTTGQSVHFQEPSDYSLAVDGLGGQYPWPSSAVVADFDGNGFDDFLVFDPQLDTSVPPEDFEFFWEVKLKLADRATSEGRLVELDGPWGGVTTLVWSHAARMGGNSDLFENVEVLASEQGPNGDIRYRYSYGTHRERRFRGFGLVEVTNGGGSFEEHGFAVAPILEGEPAYSARYRFDGTLASLTWNSYFGEWLGGFDLDVSPPYFNPLQRVCEFDVDHGTWSGPNRVQSENVDTLTMECFGWSAPGSGISHEELTAALGWGATSGNSEPVDEAVWAGQDWEGPALFRMSGLGGSGSPLSLGGRADLTAPVTTTTPDAPGGIDHPTGGLTPSQPDGGPSTQWDLFVTRWKFDPAMRLTLHLEDRDTLTLQDDLATSYFWSNRDQYLWAYQLLQTRTDDYAGAMQWRETYSNFAALNLPQLVEECGLTASTCRTWGYNWTGLQGITGELYGRTAPDGGQESWTRTWCGKPWVYTDQVGRQQATSYDPLCRATDLTWQGATSRWTWDSFNRPAIEEWETPNLDGSTTFIDQTVSYSDGLDPDVPRRAALRSDGRLEPVGPGDRRCSP